MDFSFFLLAKRTVKPAGDVQFSAGCNLVGEAKRLGEVKSVGEIKRVGEVGRVVEVELVCVVTILGG